MAQSKIELKIGSFEFKCAGEQVWVDNKLSEFLDLAPNIQAEISEQIKNPTPTQEPSSYPSDLFAITERKPKVIPENLSTFLRKKNAVEKQRRRFLGAAVWLQLNGKERVKTKDVTDALKMARQLKITNPSHQLNQNITQGFCQKEGPGFFVTPEGIEDIMRY
ncbi:hypothetical protein KH5_11770 [Urechidicola sp. KH5]